MQKQKKRNLISTRIQLEHQPGGLGLGFKSVVTIEPDIFRTQISFHFITFFFTKFHFITRKQWNYKVQSGKNEFYEERLKRQTCFDVLPEDMKKRD